MSYQSKNHEYICTFFRNLSFGTVVVMFATFITSIWLEYPGPALLMKLFATTLAVLLTSVVVRAIYYEKPTVDKKD